MQRILVTGANGQIGGELVRKLRGDVGTEAVTGADLRPASDPGAGPHVVLDVRDRDGMERLIAEREIDTVYHLASLLSVTGEAQPDLAWEVNVQGLKHILDIARNRTLQLFWPSSIAVFGPATPRIDTPQSTIIEPTTMYGVTKRSGEMLCKYYAERFGVDVRSIRYPGIISYAVEPGGGTTDYAIDMLRAAAEGADYTCFLRPDSRLPMMYMPDAIDATLDIMQASSEAITVRSSYNLAAISFSPEELEHSIRRRIPAFICRYAPDHRQRIADSWPQSIDDSSARKDWGWDHRYGLDAMVDDMLDHLTITP
ncbi:MAG: NAD-dependent epimerase/dehydratase family protein [Rhodothermales bacterium]